MKRGVKIPYEIVQRMKSYYQSGMVVSDIAKHFDVSRMVVYKYIKSGGWVRGGGIFYRIRSFFR
jgi:transposase